MLEHERIVAASSYYLSLAADLAEVAYMVDPEWQGAGLAGLLSADVRVRAGARRPRLQGEVLVGQHADDARL